MAQKTDWYRDAVVYQIYPLSFMDSNNDGYGDIPGVISKLDYLKDLGVTAIWFSPLYPSPWKDYGYDVADYRAIHPAFGTMADFDRLMEECKKRDIRVIMDMVLNHTSDQHPWFKAALADPKSKYRDYYIIRPGRRRGGKLLPPTNWTSCFTGPAWERIGETDEFYLHLFAPEQPDLNWENPEVRKEIQDILRFWLDKGVAGFRFDVFNLYSKAQPIRSDRNPFRLQKGTNFFVDGPRMHEFLQELNTGVFSHYDAYTVGESYTPDPEHAHRYIQRDAGELDSIFDFEHLTSDSVAGLKFLPKPFSLRAFKRGLLDPQRNYFHTGWNTLVLENHDCPRSVSRFGIHTRRYRYEAATMLATAAFLGWGTPFIYQGEELGLTNSRFRSMEEMKDPVSRFVFDTMTKSFHLPKALAFPMIRYGARDHARTPMQWDGSANGGFNLGAQPWQSVNPAYRKINAARDLASEKSVYHYYQKLLRLRSETPAILRGSVTEYDERSRRLLIYAREYEGKRFLIVCNFSAKKTPCALPAGFENAAVRLSNYAAPAISRELTLRPYEALVLEAR